MKMWLAAIVCLFSFAGLTNAEVLYNGGAVKGATAPSITAPKSAGGSSPRRHAADATLVSFCQSGAPYCLVADSKQNRLHLFEGGEGIMSWDVIMLPPGRVMRGFITEIDLNPSWCPTASVRRKFPNLPAGCLPPGHPKNAMGEVKIIMNGDFEGTAIRIHDTRAFGGDWYNEDSSGCVRVLNLKTEVLPEIGHGREGRVEVVFK
jgi:lipoprotein-anchoring transpeptidase ErfK/SrfK